MNKKTIGYVSIIALLAITSYFSVNLYFQQRSAHDEVDIRTFPYTIGDWKGRDIEMADEVYQILETRNLILREYVNPSDKKLMLFIIYSETNRSVFHPPEVCLIGSGAEISDKKREKVKNPGGETILASKLYSEKEDRKNIGLYCYKVGNFYTDNYYLQQTYFAFNQLFRSHIKGTTIHVSMPLDENEEANLRIMKNFMRESTRIIDRM